MIRFNGYYRSQTPKEYHDSYGGHHITEIKYTYLVFMENGSVLRFLDEDTEIFKSRVIKRIMESSSLYKILGDDIQLDLFPNLDFTEPLYFKIVSPDLIKRNEGDGNDDIYNFHPWPESATD